MAAMHAGISKYLRELARQAFADLQGEKGATIKQIVDANGNLDGMFYVSSIDFPEGDKRFIKLGSDFVEQDGERVEYFILQTQDLSQA